MTNALKDLNTFVVEKVTTGTDSTSAALGGDHASTEGPWVKPRRLLLRVWKWFVEQRSF